MNKEELNDLVDLICNFDVEELRKEKNILEIIKERKDLQNRINKAIDMLDLIIPELWNISNAMTYKIKEVRRTLGDKE